MGSITHYGSEQDLRAMFIANRLNQDIKGSEELGSQGQKHFCLAHLPLRVVFFSSSTISSFRENGESRMSLMKAPQTSILRCSYQSCQ